MHEINNKYVSATIIMWNCFDALAASQYSSVDSIGVEVMASVVLASQASGCFQDAGNVKRTVYQ